MTLDHLVNSTTKKNHTLDLLITNSLSFLEKCLLIIGFGDHYTAILEDVANQAKYFKPTPHVGKFSCGKKVTLEVSTQMPVFTINNAIETPIDNLQTTFTKNILDIQKRHIPSRMTYPTFSQPWITRECKRSAERIEQTTNSKE